MRINERVKCLRKEVLGLRQDEFAKKINLGRATISKIEIGDIVLTDRNIKAICDNFSVSEAWLRTGEGEMFASLDTDQKIAEYVGGLMDGKDTLEKRMFLLWIEMTDYEKELWLKMLQKMGARLIGGSDD